ncbi:MAG: hypothetical protein HRU13_04470 [Phycisphaerales bacterium]|nr:hypothetical protein [Phycisphaerales bacterium]
MPIRTGIDISPTTVTAAQIKIGKSGWSLLASARMSRSSEDSALEAHEARRLESLLFRRGFTSAACVINAPADALTSATMELPPATSGAPIDKLARAEYARRNQLEQGDFVLSYWGLPNNGPANQVMAVGCLIEPTDACIDSLESAGLNVAGVDDPARAMGRLLSGVPGATTVRVGARVEASGTCIVVLHHSTMLYSRSPIGLELHPDPSGHAEFASRLGREIEACVSFARHRSRSHAPAAVSILGEGAHSSTLMQSLSRKFGDSISQPVSPSGDQIDATLAPAIGLALLEDIA